MKLDNITANDVGPLKQLMKKCFFEKIRIQGDDIFGLENILESENFGGNRSSNSKATNLSNHSKSASKLNSGNQKHLTTPRSE